MPTKEEFERKKIHEVYNVDSFIQKVLKVEIKDKHRIFFRGNDYEHLDTLEIPGIYRKNDGSYIESENRMIEEVMAYKPNAFLNCKSTIEKLIIMQHYELPTRLFDITRNPLIALYFACKGNINNKGIVSIYQIPEEYIKYSSSDVVSILANLSLMNNDFNISEILLKCPENILSLYNLEQCSHVSNYEKNLHQIKKLIHLIRVEKSHFDFKIEKKHLDNYVACVLPTMNNERILAQQGAFLLFGINNGNKNLCSEFKNKSENYIETKYIEVRETNKILKQLDSLGINELTVFPELNNITKYVKRVFKR